MSDVHDVLHRLAAIGACAEAIGGRLVLRAGSRPVPSDLVGEVRRLKGKVLSALAQGSLPAAEQWRARHQESLRFWCAHYPEQEALGIAWGEMQCLWHKQYGEIVPAGVCAGCRKEIGSGPTLVLSDSHVIHLRTLNCAITYGARWRGAATRALIALGLTQPVEDE